MVSRSVRAPIAWGFHGPPRAIFYLRGLGGFYVRRTVRGFAKMARWPNSSGCIPSHTVHAESRPCWLRRDSRATIVVRNAPFGYGGAGFPRSELRTGPVAILAQERRARGGERGNHPSLLPFSSPGFLAEDRRALCTEIDPNSRRRCTPCGRYSTSSLTSPGRAYRRALLPVRNGLGSCVIRQQEPHHTVQRAQASGYDVFSQPPRSGCRGRVGYGPISCKNEECNIHKE